MKQKDDWRNKLDSWVLEFLEGYHKVSAARGSTEDPAQWHAKMEEIAAKHPQIRELGKVEILPEFLDRLRQDEEIANILSGLNVSPGTNIMPARLATIVDVAQTVTLALDEPQVRSAAGYGAGLLALILGGIYSDVSKKYFGDAGPKPDDLMWTIGTTLEVLGKTLKSGKPPEMKGKVNVELLELIKVLRKHETVRLTYGELRDAIAYAGIHVADEDALRTFIWRAKERGWLHDDEASDIH